MLKKCRENLSFNNSHGGLKYPSRHGDDFKTGEPFFDKVKFQIIRSRNALTLLSWNFAHDFKTMFIRIHSKIKIAWEI